MRRSLEYYTENFFAFIKHQQARIIEFPRYASFGSGIQSTMPYSPGIGSIAQIEDEGRHRHGILRRSPRNGSISGGAHQVIGAKPRATLLSENDVSVFRPDGYGKGIFYGEQMQKFLHEMTGKPTGSGREMERESR